MKRIIAIALVLLLAIPVLAQSASEKVIIEPTPIVTEGEYEQTADAEKLEEIILTLKDRFLDTDGYDNFNYNVNEGSDGIAVYDLYWSDSTGKLPSYINISVNEKNFVYSYYSDITTSYNWDDAPAIPKTSKNQAVAAAYAFLSKIAPDYAGEFDTDFATVSYNTYNSSYSVSFSRVRNGYVVSNENVTLTVDGSGKVYDYNAYSVTNNLDAKSSRSTQNDAKLITAFKTYLPLKLKYTSVYNSESGKYDIVLSYFVDDYNTVIDAKTGKPYSLEYEYGGNVSSAKAQSGNMYDSVMEAPAATDESASGATLSSAEKSAVKDYAGMLKASDITALIKKDGYFKFDDRLSVSSSDIYTGTSMYTDEVTYYINVRYNYSDDDMFIYANVQADAKTGEIKYYNYYEGTYNYYEEPVTPLAKDEETATDGKTPVTFEEAKPLAANILGKMYPKFFGEYVRSTEEWSDDAKISSISYTRYINGIPFENDNINVSLERESGLITSLSIGYSTDATFPKPDGIIDGEAAVDKYFEACPLDRTYLVYYKAENGVYTVDTYKQSTTAKNTALVVSYDDDLRIDAFTGKAMYNWGSGEYEYQANAYFDKKAESKLAKYPAAEKLTAMYNFDVLDVTDGFDPDASITADDFIRMLELLRRYEYPEFNGTITRTDAITAIVDILGYKKIASMPEIFVANESFTVADEYKGYIAIASALGLLDGFGADTDSALTYSDAASLIYNYIVSNPAEVKTEDVSDDYPVEDIAVETVAVG